MPPPANRGQNARAQLRRESQKPRRAASSNTPPCDMRPDDWRDEEGAHRVVAERGVEHRDRMRRCHRIGQRGEAIEIVQRLGDFRRAAMAVAHLAGEPARIGGASAERRARSPGRGCGLRHRRARRIDDDRAPASRRPRPPRRRNRLHARRRRRSRARPVPASPAHGQRPRRPRPAPKLARRFARFAFAVIGVAGRGKISLGQLGALRQSPSRDARAEPDAVGAGRRAEKSAARGLQAGERIVSALSSSAATARTAAAKSAIWLGKTSRNRPEMRIVTSTRGRPSRRAAKPRSR